MEINTNPNYLNNVQNQNAQGANSATAENVVEENLFDGNEANATQNNAVSQDYQNAEMLNTFVAAFTAVMAPFMQMMTQFMTTITTALTAKNNSDPQAKYEGDVVKNQLKDIGDKKVEDKKAPLNDKKLGGGGPYTMISGDTYITGKTNRNELRIYQDNKDLIESELAKFENHRKGLKIREFSNSGERVYAYDLYIGEYSYDQLAAADTDKDGYLTAKELESLESNKSTRKAEDIQYPAVAEALRLIYSGSIN